MTVDTPGDIGTELGEGFGFSHPALFYDSPAQYLDQLVPFIADGVGAGEPVAVFVPGDKHPALGEALDAALGSAADRVTLGDMRQAGRNPGRIMALLRGFADSHLDRHVRLIGEPIWLDRSPGAYAAAVQHEALINRAFTGRNVTIACPYDTTTLPAQVLADAHTTHPVVWQDGGHHHSSSYDPDRAVARYNQRLDTGRHAARYRLASITELATARHFAGDTARRLGVSEDRIGDVELIVSELLTNSLTHTNGAAELALWLEADALICSVRDTGRPGDPLAGRLPIACHADGPRGLLLVNAFADLVRTHTSAHGRTVHAHISPARPVRQWRERTGC